VDCGGGFAGDVVSKRSGAEADGWEEGSEMNESEFRDWARRAQGDFNERLKRLEKRFQDMNLAPPRLRDVDIQYDVKELYERLGSHIRTGKVTALGICFLTLEDGPMTGFAHEVWERAGLAGVAGQLWFELLTKPVKEEGHEQGDAGKVGEGVPQSGREG
jgi:hypothetical protein